MNEILYPFSAVYGFLSKLDRKMKNSVKLDKPVISVGNITWGGTGKTPIVIDLLEFLIGAKRNPAVLTRGYGRKSSEPLLLRNGAEGISSGLAGDEPLLIARSVPGADVIVGSKRYDNALRFGKETDNDVYVLDDGFQHWKIKRDLDIVCVNAADPFGNGMLIPAGILREKPDALKRAGMVIITNSDMVTEKELDALKKRIYGLSGKEAAVTYYGGYKYKQLGLREDFDVNKFKTSSVYSLSGIGFAGGFKNSLERSGVKIKDSFILKDHEKYDRKKIYDILEKTGDSYIVTTAKDAVKIAAFADKKINDRVAVLTVKPVFKTGREQWEKEILNSLRFF